MTGIFISYRREDSGPYAGRLYDTLVTQFGRDRIFFDLDTIGPGEDFREVIQRTCSSCEVLLAVIGKEWATARDKAGKLRLEGKRDTLRIEISTALEKGLRVIPVLVGGAEMPEEEALPEDLRALAYRNAWDISDKRFQQDVQLLVDAIKKLSSRVPSETTAQKPVPAKPSLFPLFGVTLGKTTVRELANIGSELIDIETRQVDGYAVEDVAFWWANNSNVADHMYLIKHRPLPAPWQKLGLDWRKSYDQWLSLLAELGYAIEVRKEPRIVLSFSAEVIGRINDDLCPHRIELVFKHGRGTKLRSSAETLYSIAINFTGSLESPPDKIS